MNTANALLLTKVAILIAIVFATSVDIATTLLGILLSLVVLPRVKTAIKLLMHSGYMRSPSGEIFTVSSVDRSKLLSYGFRELSILSTLTLTGSYPVWKEE